MTARTRERSGPNYASSGFQFYTGLGCGWGAPWGPYQRDGAIHWHRYEKMVDTVNSQPWPDTNYSHEKFRGRPPTVSGICQRSFDECSDIKYKGVHTNTALVIIDYNSASSGHLSTGLSDAGYDYINRALSIGNPGAPKVDLTAFIAELRELPRTLADLLRRGGWGSKPIAYTFGVAPFLNDVKSIISLSEAIDQRQKMLTSLQGKVRKQYLNLAFRETKDNGSTVTAPGTYTGINVYPTIRTTRRVWCVKKHTIKTNRYKPPKLYDTNYCRRLLTSDTSVGTFWELFPWSWLVDYFVGIQEMISTARGNRIPGYSVSSLCIMIETKTRCDYLKYQHVDRWTGGIFSPGYWERISRKREVFPDPSPTFPRLAGFLTDGQVSNLMQLAASMATRR